MKLHVIRLGDPRLRLTAAPIAHVTDATRELAAAMILAMDEEEGVGLAAPQVGHSIRLVVLRFGTDGPGKEEVFAAVNPVVSDLSSGSEMGEEGCLSVPGIYGPVRRATSCTVTYTDLEGAQQTRALTGFDARIIQHEVDHLDGVLFIDRVEDKSKLVRMADGQQPAGAI